MTKNIGIFTTNSVDKIHPRIEMQVNVLRDAGYNVKVIRSTSKKESFFYEIRNLFSLKYFKWGFIASSKSKIDEFEVVHIYDLQLLPLAKKAHQNGKKVVYETLDDNVELHFHALSKKLPFLSLFKSAILKKYKGYEREAAEKYCDQVIVNSKNLLANFDKANLIYYASPLEVIKIESYDHTKESAFLYLGKLTESKGAAIYQELIDEHKTKLIFLGKAYDQSAKKLIENENVISLGNFSSSELMEELSKLIRSYNLIGLSIILPENKSYALQEANKDIDYMAMGMPFIGNERIPTFEKIKVGAGVLYSDKSGVEALLHNEGGKYDHASERGTKMHKHYTQQRFKSELLKIYQSL